MAQTVSVLVSASDLVRLAKVLALTCSEPPGEVTHWTGRAMAKAVGVSLTTVQRIWQANTLAPRRLRSFKRSNDPAFAEKVEDVAGLYMHPPAHAVVVSIDEKSQIQALDRTRPDLPLKPGSAHDDPRLQAPRHDHALRRLQRPERRRDGPLHAEAHASGVHPLLNAVDREIPPGEFVHAIMDNYATYKHPKVKAWLARHPFWTFHFTPTSASRRNAVENFFSVLTRRRIRRGVFESVVDLQAASNRYLEEHNEDPKPFVWTKTAKTSSPRSTASMYRPCTSVH